MAVKNGRPDLVRRGVERRSGALVSMLRLQLMGLNTPFPRKKVAKRQIRDAQSVYG